MEVIRDYSKVVGYKDNIQKSNNFHVSVINKLNLKLKVQYHFHKHHKMKYLGVYLTKYVQNLHRVNQKTLKKKYFKNQNKWRDIPYLWVGSLNIVKVSVLPNLTYRFIVSAIKIPASNFVDIVKPILKFIWKDKKAGIINTLLKEN